MRNVHGIVVGLGILLTSSSALAQEPAPQPSGSGTAGGQVDTLPAPRPSVSASASAGAKEEKKDDGISDHERVVGKFGVMYFGVSQQPIGAGPVTGVSKGNPVPTPVIGARYWFKEKMGLDAGLGLGLSSSSNAVKANGGAEVDTDGPAVVAFALHAGLPIALAYGKHYKFLFVPELNFGYATQTVAAQNVQPGQVAPGDQHFTGLRFDVGARVGTEIQFGFIGIPELALQASIGLDLRRQVWHASQDSSGTTPEQSSSHGEWTFGTTVQNDPWAIFVNNISAIYYFP
jgi:hypothetical protein